MPSGDLESRPHPTVRRSGPDGEDGVGRNKTAHPLELPPSLQLESTHWKQISKSSPRSREEGMEPRLLKGEESSNLWTHLRTTTMLLIIATKLQSIGE